MRRVLGALLAGCSVLLAPGSLRAGEHSLVRVVSAPHASAQVDEARTRLTAELRAAGFSVRVITAPEGPLDSALLEGATATVDGGASADASVAAIAIVETARGAVTDVCVADRVTHETRCRRVDVGDPRAPNAASDLAVRSVELLRASLLEVSGVPKREPAVKSVPRKQAPAEASRSTPASTTASTPQQTVALTRHGHPKGFSARADAANSIELGLGVLASGGFGAAPVPLLRIGYDLPAAFSLRALLVPLLASTELRSTAGTVALRQSLVAADLAYAVHFERARLEASLSIGAGLYHLSVKGNATPPQQGKEHDLLAAAILAGVGLRLRVIAGFSVQTDFQIIAVVPEPAVTILAVEVAHAGRPAFLPSLGIVYRF